MIKYEKSKHDLLIKLRDIKLEATKRFFLLQQAYQDEKIAQKSVEYSRINLDESMVRLEAGVGTRFEVLEAKTQLARDKQKLNNYSYLNSRQCLQA